MVPKKYSGSTSGKFDLKEMQQLVIKNHEGAQIGKPKNGRHP